MGSPRRRNRRSTTSTRPAASAKGGNVHRAAPDASVSGCIRWTVKVMTGRAASIAIALVAAIACSSSSTRPSTGGYLGSLGSPGCSPGAAFHDSGSEDGIPEAGFDSSRGSVWALVFGSVPPRAGKDIKVVWRMTGSGDFTFRISDVKGATIPLLWGREGHGSSSWKHPGSEVGTGLKFPHAGCWDIHVAKPNVDADLWLEVAA